MTLIRREGFVTALHDRIVWYSSQHDHGSDAATRLAEEFARAVDASIGRIAIHPELGAVWAHRRGYRFTLVERPSHRWLIFYRYQDLGTVELVELIRSERDLPRRVDAI